MNFFVEALRNLALTLLRGFKFHQAPLIPPLTPLLGKSMSSVIIAKDG